jgi:hypothetical protein
MTLFASRFAFVLCLCATLGSPAFAQDISREQALYETHCVSCHDSSIHKRPDRLVRSWEGLYEQVMKWQRETGLTWETHDVDYVARYLNDRFYHMPCPEQVC